MKLEPIEALFPELNDQPIPWAKAGTHLKAARLNRQLDRTFGVHQQMRPGNNNPTTEESIRMMEWSLRNNKIHPDLHVRSWGKKLQY